MARTSSKIVKSIPASETGSKTICFTKSNESGDKYIVTQNSLKGQFTLWKCVEGGFERKATSNTPLELDEMIPYEMQLNMRQ